MGYPSNMNDEQLHAFGFAIDPDDPSRAKHRVYPQFTVRYLCSKCGIWVSTMRNGECVPCRNGKMTKVENVQVHKLYKCCNDLTCPSIQKVYAVLGQYEVSWEPCLDGFGTYLLMKWSHTWTIDERNQFHSALGCLCVSFQKARKIVCTTNPRKRSKLPKTE